LCFEPLGTLQLSETTAKDARPAVSFDRIGVVHPPLSEIFQVLVPHIWAKRAAID
jgi:hypothetical protein